MGQFHFDPDSYLELMAQRCRTTRGCRMKLLPRAPISTPRGACSIWARARARPLAACSTAIPGLSSSASIRVARARKSLPDADLRVARLEDPLPAGRFDLVVSALAVHHLTGLAKADLFARVAEALRPGGRLVLADVVVPDDPADVVTPVDGVYDVPSRIDEQVAWLDAAGLGPRIAWTHRDLAVLVADR